MHAGPRGAVCRMPFLSLPTGFPWSLEFPGKHSEASKQKDMLFSTFLHVPFQHQLFTPEVPFVNLILTFMFQVTNDHITLLWRLGIFVH